MSNDKGNAKIKEYVVLIQSFSATIDVMRKGLKDIVSGFDKELESIEGDPTKEAEEIRLGERQDAAEEARNELLDIDSSLSSVLYSLKIAAGDSDENSEEDAK